jgi:murein DD-endopeptidase
MAHRFGLAVAVLIFLLGGNALAAGTPLKLALPIECNPGKTCWIANYVDVDPGPGALDYSDGPRSYNKHKGIDFAISDHRAIGEGVAVLSAADGVVRGSRNRMPDIDFRRVKPETLKGKECGNGVVIDHGGGWVSQYCHLRKGSVQVKKGQRIKAGDKIGFVGLSGKTQFPHLHFQVFYKKKIVDPFTGKLMLARSNETNVSAPLWRKPVSKQFPYRGSEIYSAGFAAGKPSHTAARRGDYRDPIMTGPAPVIYFWSDIFSVRNGDRLVWTLFDARNNRLSRRKMTFNLKRSSARRFIWVGFKHKSTPWPKGSYRVHIGLSRTGKKGEERYQATRTVTIN